MNAFDTALVVIDFQTALTPVMHNDIQLVEKTEILIKGARLLEIPIIVTQQYTKGLGDTIPELKEALGEFDSIDKTAFSCVGDKNFREALKNVHCKNIIISGIEAHICVLQTVIDLIDLGYNVFLAADCVGSRFKKDMRYALRRMFAYGAVPTTAESVLFEIMKDAKHPARKAVSALIK
ncbi:MAG: hydrolase [Clostridiales bacterium]|jgi:nicotinamidase-related amidase|nr:hydrolase [Clostridiales bacterium]